MLEEKIIRENERLKAAFTLMKYKHERDIKQGYSGTLGDVDVKEILNVAGMDEKEVDIIPFVTEPSEKDEEVQDEP